MSEQSGGPGWWLASDGKWYPPELAPAAILEAPTFVGSATDTETPQAHISDVESAASVGHEEAERSGTDAEAESSQPVALNDETASPVENTEDRRELEEESAAASRFAWFRRPVPIGLPLVVGLVAIAGLGIALAVSASDASKLRADLEVASANRDRLSAASSTQDETVKELRSDLRRAEGERDDALATAAAAEDAARIKVEGEMAGRSAELDQREAAVAARESAVGSAEVARDQNTFGDGVWEVGVDIRPGKYKAPGGSSCYWAKHDRSGDIIDNDLPGGPTTVVIESSVFSFKSSDCGDWVKVG